MRDESCYNKNMVLVADLTRDEIVSALACLEPQLRAAGVTQLAIFGSRARGDQNPDSDLDVLIDVNSQCKFSMIDLVGIAHVVEDTLGLSANIFMRRSLEPQFAATIAPDVVEIF